MQYGDFSRVLEISRHAAQHKSTPIKCEAAVAIQMSAGLALVSVSRQHARSSLVFLFVLLFLFFLSFLTPPLCVFFLSSFLFPTLYTFFFLCVRVCVCLRIYVRAFVAISCVSANDNVQHTKLNIRYDN